MMKYFKLEIMIDNYLSDITNYSEAAYDYLTGQQDNVDRDEIIMYLSSVPETVEFVKKLIAELEDTYQNEIGDENCEFDEQLQ